MALTVQGVNHLGMTVADLDRSLALFVGVLGFTRGARVELDEEFVTGVTGVRDSRLVATFVHGPGIDVELLQYERAGTAAPSHPNDPGAAHLALFVESIPEVVDAAVDTGWRLLGGIQPIADGPRAGGSAAYLHDGAGGTVELVQRPLPGPSAQQEKREADAC